MIVQPEKMTFDNKKFSMILYGSPGVGKTTLALSAPAPIIIDFDRGMSRVKAQHRKAAIFCDTYVSKPSTQMGDCPVRSEKSLSRMTWRR